MHCCCCSVTKSCLTLCNPMDCSTPGFSVLQYLQICLSRVCSNSPLSQWCNPTISSSVAPFSCLQSFPASGSFPMNRLFASGGQSIRASASASVLPVNMQGWSPLGMTGLIFLLSKGLSRVFSTTIQKHQFFGTKPSLWSNSHIRTWLLERVFISPTNVSGIKNKETVQIHMELKTQTYDPILASRNTSCIFVCCVFWFFPAKIHEEIDQVIGPHRIPSVDDRAKCPTQMPWSMRSRDSQISCPWASPIMSSGTLISEATFCPRWSCTSVLIPPSSCTPLYPTPPGSLPFSILQRWFLLTEPIFTPGHRRLSSSWLCPQRPQVLSLPRCLLSTTLPGRAGPLQEEWSLCAFFLW